MPNTIMNHHAASFRPRQARGTGVHRPGAPAVMALVAMTAAVLLATAAVAKSLAWWDTGQVRIGAWDLPTPLAIASLAWEGGLAAALFVSPWSWSAWRAAAATFLVLGMVAGGLALTGSGSCGCFGRMEVPAWATALVDGVLAVAFRLARPSSPPAGVAAPRRRAALAAALAALCAVAWLGAHDDAIRTAATGPAALIASLPPRCQRGAWIICCYRSDCSHCRAGMPGWLLLAKVDAQRRPATRWAFVLLDAQPSDDDPCPADAPVEHLWRAQPAMASPTFLHLADGALRAAPGPPPSAAMTR